MSDRMIDIEGRQFSESTVKEALEMYCEFVEKKSAPIITFAEVKGCPEDKRVIIRPSDDAIQKIKDGFKTVVLDANGDITNYSYYRFTPLNFDRDYINLQPIFGEINE